MNLGGSPLGTAMGFVVPRVYYRLSEEWGEAAWTAPELFNAALRAESESASLRFVFGLPV